MAAKTVQAIDKKSIHQICSGQVVLNIATAVKELIENSLDAGATNIDVRLKDFGAEVLEVVDNGCGVEPCNFEALTLKHYTSKLQDFSDLTTVETFGFRGEALSSLCALSNLSIITHHSTQTAATRLEYDHNGNLVSKTPCARGVGTTVVLLNLFSTLPVRHKEFLRNIKKEFTKLVHVLQGYCLVSTGVRITCSNQVGKGKKTAVVSTNGSSHVKNNITCVFGPKQIQNLMVFDQTQPSEEDCSELGLDTRKLDKQSTLFNINGFLSKPDHGMGRSSTDRQFFYINKRPCELSKVSRTVNEVYHMYNRHQFPFVMLDISLARDSVDVNVTPDKRQVFIQEEKLLLAILKTSLKKMFEPVAATFDLNQKPLTQIKLPRLVTQSMTSTGDSPEERETERLYDSNEEEIELVKKCTTPVTMSDLERGLFPSLASFKRKFSSLDEDVDQTPKQPLAKQVKLTSIFSHSSKKETEEEGLEDHPYCTVQGDDSEKFNVRSPSQDSKNEEGISRISRIDTESEHHNLSSEINRNDHVDCSSVLEKALDQTDMSPIPNQQENCSQSVVTLVTPRRANPSSNGVSAPEIAFHEERKEFTVSFSMTELKNKTQSANEKPSTEFEARQFRARISPDCNANAEKELRKNVSKDMFSKMQILGQFNLGFIITKLGKDLFIVDQHASDEKFNFEIQQQSTTIRSQSLIAPQRLELTAVNEAILIDNIEIFRKNGFDFDIDENAEATNRVKLTSLPVSKNWTFGFEDVEELIFMLSDSPGVMCRPSRVRKMFASRACRMSIMVGTALNHTQMKKIVCHMGKIDHPWNCPHGRPTMRHLINLGMLPSTEQ